jgi:hypothetical protein
MNDPRLLSLFSIAISAVALLVSVAAFVYGARSFYAQRRQTELMEKDQARRQSEDESAAQWAAKFDEAVAAVLKIAPGYTETGGQSRNAYGWVFPKDLQQRIESHLIHADFGRSQFAARQASSDSLQMPPVQQTIQEVLDAVKKFKATDPGNAKRLGLL